MKGFWGLLLFAFFGITLSFGQSKPKAAKIISLPEAIDLYNAGNFTKAYPGFVEALKKDPDNPELNFQAGICVLNGNVEKTKGIQYFEKAAKAKKADKDLMTFYKARAAHQNYRFDEAMELYSTYLRHCPDKQKPEINRFIENCKNGIQLMQFPLDVSLENLGPNINSPFIEFIPLLPAGENYLMFTSKRKSSLENPGILFGDIYISEVKAGVFSKAKELGPPVNTPFNEEASGLSADGRTMFLNIDNAESGGTNDIWISTGKGKTFKKPEPFNLNTTEFLETSATITPDGNTLLYVSDRKEGKGGKDIYSSKKLPNGTWGNPINMTGLNTEYDEDYPFMTPNGKYLYFASEGHNSIGGYDIFKCTWDSAKNEWSAPENLGHPINTPMDEFNFVASDDGREGYTTALRPEGFGDMDIYKVTFNQIDPKYTIFKGVIHTADSVSINYEARLTIKNKKDNSLYGLYSISPAKRGKYLFYLPSGKFEVLIEVPWMMPYTEDLTVLDKSGYQNELTKHFFVQPKEQKKVPAKADKKTSVKGTKK